MYTGKTKDSGVLPKFGKKHYERLKFRAEIILNRVRSGRVKNLDDEKAELSSLNWVLNNWPKETKCQTE